MLSDMLSSQAEALPVLPLSSLSPDSTLLVICDMVEGFADHGALSSPRVRKLASPIAALLTRCNAAGIPTVAFADTHPADAAEFERYPVHCVAGTDECEIVAELKTVGGYTVVEKNSTNGMLTDAFPAYLEENPQRTTILLCGCCTDICVLQFALTLKAYGDHRNRPYRIIVPDALTDTFDGDGHHGETFHNLALLLMRQAGVETIKEVSYGA